MAWFNKPGDAIPIKVSVIELETMGSELIIDGKLYDPLMMDDIYSLVFVGDKETDLINMLVVEFGKDHVEECIVMHRATLPKPLYLNYIVGDETREYGFRTQAQKDQEDIEADSMNEENDPLNRVGAKLLEAWSGN